MEYMQLIFAIFKEYNNQSTVSLVLAFTLLLLIESIAYKKGNTILYASNKRFKLISACVLRLCEFIIASFGIAICFIGYWIFKELKSDSYIANLDVLLPFVLFGFGFVINVIITYIYSRRDQDKYTKKEREKYNKKIENKKKTAEKNPREKMQLAQMDKANAELKKSEQRERNFLVLFTLIYFMVIGFFSYKSIPIKQRNGYNTGYWIIPLIFGRFFWFDTSIPLLKENIKEFIPSGEYAIQLILPVSIVSVIVFYTLSLDLSHVIGIFLGLLLNVILFIIIAVIIFIRDMIKKILSKLR